MAIVVSTVYLSESAPRGLQVLARHRPPGSKLLNHFVDAAYERCSYCIGGAAAAVADAVLAVANDAFDRLDMRAHRGTHPTLGAVDHISVNFIAGRDEDAAVSAARDIAARVAARVPVLLYGGAHPARRSLAETRRASGAYFGDRPFSLEPDLGPPTPDPRLGVCCCGATPHVLNYNMQLDRGSTLAQAKRIASAVRTRGCEQQQQQQEEPRALAGVEALALRHEAGTFEIACNLLDVERSPPHLVLARAQRAAAEEGSRVTHEYTIGLTRDQIVARLREDPEIAPLLEVGEL